MAFRSFSSPLLSSLSLLSSPLLYLAFPPRRSYGSGLQMGLHRLKNALKDTVHSAQFCGKGMSKFYSYTMKTMVQI